MGSNFALGSNNTTFSKPGANYGVSELRGDNETQKALGVRKKVVVGDEVSTRKVD